MLMKIVGTLLAICVALCVMAQSGCPHKSIADITADPGRYYNKEVNISGEVVNSFGALGQGIFEIDDGTGRMWVFTERFGVPSKGAHVGVTGRVIPGINFAGQNYATVLRETRRRSHRG